jgi:hypothetical protein
MIDFLAGAGQGGKKRVHCAVHQLLAQTAAATSGQASHTTASQPPVTAGHSGRGSSPGSTTQSSESTASIENADGHAQHWRTSVASSQSASPVQLDTIPEQ